MYVCVHSHTHAHTQTPNQTHTHEQVARSWHPCCLPLLDAYVKQDLKQWPTCCGRWLVWGWPPTQPGLRWVARVYVTEGKWVYLALHLTWIEMCCTCIRDKGQMCWLAACVAGLLHLCCSSLYSWCVDLQRVWQGCCTSVAGLFTAS